MLESSPTVPAGTSTIAGRIVGVRGDLGGERLRLRKRLAHVIVRGKSDAGEGAALTVRRDETDSSIRSLDRLIKRLLPQPAKLRERLAARGRRGHQ